MFDNGHLLPDVGFFVFIYQQIQLVLAVVFLTSEFAASREYQSVVNGTWLPESRYPVKWRLVSRFFLLVFEKIPKGIDAYFQVFNPYLEKIGVSLQSH